MNNNLLQLKIKQRLNKLSSNDYDAYEGWMVVEAFNREQNLFVREGAAKGEDSKENVDDWQKVIISASIAGINKSDYFETVDLPKDYFAGKRVSAKISTKNCPEKRTVKIYDGEEANLDDLLTDENKCPSFEWGETFKTQLNNKIRIHTAGEFTVSDVTLTYYRRPRPISFVNGVNEYDNATTDVECEFKDDLVEILINRTCSTLAGDVEAMNQFQRLKTTP